MINGDYDQDDESIPILNNNNNNNTYSYTDGNTYTVDSNTSSSNASFYNSSLPGPWPGHSINMAPQPNPLILHDQDKQDKHGKQQQQDNQQTFTTYKRRWWVLSIFTLLSLNQCNFWITFPTIAKLASQYYNVPIKDIDYLTAIAAIIFAPFLLIFMWSINQVGIRRNLLIASFLVTMCGVIRSIPGQGENLFSLIIVAQALNAAGGPCIMIVPTKLSNVWFSPSERTFSTAIGTLANFSGSAIGFLLSLYATTGERMRYLLLAEAVSGLLIFIAICIYFPEQPPTPPSASAMLAANEPKPQTTLLQSWKELWNMSLKVLREPSATLMIASVAITSGTYGSWSTVLTQIVAPVFDASDAKWLGFWGILAGLFGGIICGIIHDKVHNYKILIITILTLNTITFVIFSLICSGVLPGWYWLGQLVNIIGGCLINGYYPIIYEAVVEVSYPVPESIGTAIISFLINIFTLVSILLGSAIPPLYMNWILVGCSATSTLLIFFAKEEYKRSKDDQLKIK
ncbi:hypothetical protein SAMD00019534_083660, partial [Acytostelium subglobosum LB1]|uniref:hypothetical protein n=1 Tax=Acytostelium subglobosum LB1 TaxID=1410327 RepID=UPI0006451B01